MNRKQKPFQVVKTNLAGLALMATEPIPPMSVIMADQSALIAPIISSVPAGHVTCCRCFRILAPDDSSHSTCSRCGLALCNNLCNDKLHRADCSALMHLAPEVRGLDRWQLVTPCIGCIRFLRCKRQSPNLLRRLSNSWPSGYVMSPMEQSISHTITSGRLPERVDGHEVAQILGIISTNGVEVRRGSGYAVCVAVFPEFSMMNHACMCNAMYNAEYQPASNSFQMVVRAQRQIHPGHQITIRYLDSLSTVTQRRTVTRSLWNFECRCFRCVDPTEAQSMASGVKCGECSSGFALPSMDDDSWLCDQCHITVSGQTMEQQILGPLSEAKKQISFDFRLDPTAKEEDEAEHLCDSLKLIDLAERWLWQAGPKLHPNHVWMVQVEYQLVIAYSRLVKQVLEKRHAELADKLRPFRERIIQACMHVLEVFTMIDPGVTRWRGVMMQKLVPAWLLVAKQNLDQGSISEQEFQHKVNFAMLATKEAVLCLSCYKQ